ncbi:MAG: hypothetical protein WA816_01490 [Bacteroidales bacterium]
MKKRALFSLISPAKRGKLFRRFIFVFSLVFYSLWAIANNPLATKQQIANFRNTKTCVVMESGVSFFNAPVKDAVQKYWKVTGFEFIDQREFELRRTDPKYSFIVLMDGAFDKDPGGVSYSYMSLVLGDASGNLTKMPEFCSVPLSYSHDLDADYEYVIPAVIKFMQIHLNNLEKDRMLISINGLKYYNKSGFKDKILLLNKDKMALNADSPQKIKSVYPYSIKLLDIKQIQEEMAGSPVNKLFHFHIGPAQDAGAGKCFEMLFDVEGNLYYFNSRKITNDNPDGFNLKDFNNIR